jgi:AcrR family transcriptional regulator
MTSSGGTRRAEQAERTRALLVKTAERLFAERGYDATSLQDIADEVGLTKAAVYYYFKTKQALLEAVAEIGRGQAAAVIEQTARLRSRSARIRHLVDGVVELVIAHRHSIELARNDPVMRREHELKRHADAIETRALTALYGPEPTLAERAAYYLASNIVDVVAALPDCTDDELRAVLAPLCRRVLTVRG